MLRHLSRGFSFYLFKYAFKEIGFSFIFGSLIFLFIMLMFQVIRLSEFAVEHQVSLVDLWTIARSLLLSFTPIALPVSFLFCVLLGVSRANSDGEMIGFQAQGISLVSVFVPFCVLSLGLSFFVLYLSFYTVPKGNREFELMIEKVGNEKAMSALKPGVFLDGFFGLVLFAEQIVPVKNELKNVFIFDDREPENPLAITADSGLLQREASNGFLTLRLNQGTIYCEKKYEAPYQQKVNFDVYDINLKLKEAGNSWRAYSLPSYNYDQLIEQLRGVIPDPAHRRNVETEVHRRFSLSFSCLIFSALGFFIGILSHKGIRSTAVLICLLVALVYWLAYIVATGLASESRWPVSLLVWIPNLIFLIVSYLCYRKYRYR